MNIKKYWEDILNQNAPAIHNWFAEKAWVNWHNTNEHFTVDEFIRANCEYPGDWAGMVERCISFEDQIITVVHVFSRDDTLHFHVTSFIRIENEKIVSIDEYWGEDSIAPDWRKNLNIGSKIK